jgi:hypothetical protein
MHAEALGMPVTAPPLKASPGQMRELEALARSPHSPTQAVRRARALLMAAQGASNVEIAQRCGVTPRTVAAWRARFAEEGTSTVRQAGRGQGPPTVLSPAAVRALLVPSAAPSPGAAPGAALLRSLARTLGREAGRPLGMAGLYLGAAQRAVALRDGPREQPIHAPLCRTHNDYLAFLRRLDWHVPGTERIHLVLDRISPQVAHFAVDRWLGNPRRRRFETSVVPDPALWIELVRALLRAGGLPAASASGAGR